MSKGKCGRDRLAAAWATGDNGPLESRQEVEPRVIQSARLKRWLPLALIVAGMALVLSMGWHQHLTLERVVANRDALKGVIHGHFVLALVVYMAVYITVAALSLPGAGALTVAGGLLFGVWVATPSAVVAATIGAVIIFVIARSSLGTALLKSAGPWLDKFRKGFEKEGLAYMLFLRLVPFPFWVINLAPALLGVPLRTFAIGTFIGIIPGTIAFAYVGDTLDRVIGEGKVAYEHCAALKAAADCKLAFDVADLPVRQILLALTLIGIVSLLPTLLRRWRARNAAV